MLRVFWELGAGNWNGWLQLYPPLTAPNEAEQKGRGNVEPILTLLWIHDIAEGRIRSSGTLEIFRFPDSVALHPVDQGFAADIEITGGTCLVPAAPLQGLQDEFLLYSLQANTLWCQVDFESIRAGSLLAQEFWQVLNRNLVAPGQDNDSLHYILELANVAGPAVSPKIR